MRLGRGDGAKSLIALFVVVLAGFLAATSLGSHDPEHPFAGNWAVSFQTGFTGTVSSTGTFSFAFVDDATGSAAMIKIIPDSDCLEPADYYVGSWSEGSVSGTLAGCGRPPEFSDVFFAYTDSSGSLAAYVRVSLDPAGQTFSGDRFVDPDGGGNGFDFVGKLEGTFAGHFAGDGAEEPPPPVEEPPEEPPPPACPTAAAAGAGRGGACPPPPKCLGKPATIVANDENAGSGFLYGTEGDDVIVDFPGRALSIFGGGGNDRICGGAARDVISGGDGNDHLSGGGGGDELLGEGGNDRLLGGAGGDYLEGDEGVDAVFGGPDNDVLRGWAGPDLLVGEAGDDHLYGGEGDDIAIGGPGNDTLHGEGDDDSLFGGNGVDRLEGASGDDELNGGGGSDSLFGGRDDDLLVGGTAAPDKIFSGGPGSDTCRGNMEIRLGCEKGEKP